MATGGLAIVNSAIDTISSWIATYGYPAVFAAALIETIFPPIPSEIIFPLVGFTVHNQGLGIEHAIGMGAVGALGATVGAVIIYFVAMKVGKFAILRYGKYARIGESELNKAEAWFEKYGYVAVFFGRMAPAVREIISIPAGIGRMNFPKFVIFTFCGSLVWTVALTLAGYYVAEAYDKLSEQLSSWFSVIGIAILIVLAAIIGYKYYSKKYKSSIKKT